MGTIGRRLYGAALLALAAAWPTGAGAGEALAVAIEIEGLLLSPHQGRVAGAPPLAPGVADFYRARGFRPLWLADGAPTLHAGRAIELLAEAGRDGLEPADYAVEALRGRLEAAGPGALAELELMLSSAVAHFAIDLRRGRAASRRIDPELAVIGPGVDVAAALQRFAAGELARALADLTPANPYYHRLRRALGEYRGYARRGGWLRLDDPAKLERGMSGPAVERLKAVLLATGDLAAPLPEGRPFDDALDLALRRFQRRHGLAVDGVVGPRTRAEINVPVAERLRQIVVNMERWRWLPDDLGDRYVLVNMAGFELEAVDSGQSVLAMRVIVGQPYRRTPVFSDRIRYLELNPTWTVPPRIAVEDLLPKIRRDPAMLAEMGMRVFAGWSADARELAPAEVDWSRYGKGRFPFKLRQDPGPKNALGRIKFMFPNKHDVYLHDTPSPELFRRAVRSFSSGCIRVEQPLALALFLLGEAGWDDERMARALAGGRTERVNLQRPVPVHLTYSTAWIGEGGDVHFRNDIYERDKPLLAALFPR